MQINSSYKNNDVKQEIVTIRINNIVQPTARWLSVSTSCYEDDGFLEYSAG